jgi:hypothetical protein
MTDQFRVIPQLFFDLISCYVPGVILLCCLALALPDQSWGLLQYLGTLEILKGDKGQAMLGVAAAVVVAIVPYAIGALLGAPIHAVERVKVSWISPFIVPDHLWQPPDSPAPADAGQAASIAVPASAAPFPAPGRRQATLFYRLTPKAKQLLLNVTAVERGASDILLFDWYDYLRLHHPSVGEFAAKLRAEMMMFGAFTIVAAFTIIAHVAFSQRTHAWTMIGLMLFGGLSAWRWWDHRATWHFAVANFYARAIETDSDNKLSSPQPAPESPHQ